MYINCVSLNISYFHLNIFVNTIRVVKQLHCNPITKRGMSKKLVGGGNYWYPLICHILSFNISLNIASLFNLKNLKKENSFTGKKPAKYIMS